MKSNQNLLLMTDVYKLNCVLGGIKPRTTKIYSYLCARSTKKEKSGELVTVFLNGKVTKEYKLQDIRERAKV